MKRLASLLIVFSLVSTLLLSSAVQAQTVDASSGLKEKVYCAATLEDNFKDGLGVQQYLSNNTVAQMW